MEFRERKGLTLEEIRQRLRELRNDWRVNPDKRWAIEIRAKLLKRALEIRGERE